MVPSLHSTASLVLSEATEIRAPEPHQAYFSNLLPLDSCLSKDVGERASECHLNLLVKAQNGAMTFGT